MAHHFTSVPSFVYVLRSDRNGRYYTGFSSAPKVRLIQHNEGQVRATRHLRPWVLVYVEECADPTAARKREYEIKSMKSRSYIESLIGGGSG
ncbi:MAG: GIY-YIG nuclease family protein [Chloroflexi bacterium]|nr:MAG: GIY-YIG nuclease family protein [Chloroflexota bacterium]